MSGALCRHPVPAGVRLISVDVFDTLLLRNAKPEILRFSEVAKEQARLLASRGQRVAPGELLHSRIFCAKVCYQSAGPNCGERDARLTDILRLMIATLRLSGLVTVAELLQMELEYEKRNLRVNHELVAFLQQQRKTRRVVLTSDTYFGSSELAGLVASLAGDCCDGVYASCDYSLTKSCGGLFRLLWERERCNPAEILHLGDNHHSDVIRPRLLGLSAWHLPRPRTLALSRRMRQMLARYRFRQEAL